MAKKGIKQHVPLVIWIDGKPQWTIGVKQIISPDFPPVPGRPPFRANGPWTI